MIFAFQTEYFESAMLVYVIVIQYLLVKKRAIYTVPAVLALPDF